MSMSDVRMPQEVSVTSQGDDKPEEARRAPRVRTFLQARLSYAEGAMSTACTVNQLSETGARITLPTSFALPEVFDLAIPQRNMTRRAKLVWRKDDQIGVNFVEAEEPQAAPVASDAARIKALEAENAKLKAQIGVLMQQLHRLTED